LPWRVHTDSPAVEPLLRRKLQVGGREVAIEDVVHLGMVAFAGATEQMLMASFGPCMRDNFAWAMDPRTSCEAPGCSDPYAGSPLSWTFKNSDTDRQPRFVRTTHSYMPACNSTPGSKSCTGQVPTTFTGQGLEFARKVIADYKSNPAPFTIDERTRFVNVLITDGQTSAGSSDVHGALAALMADGVDTYVIGFGSGNELDRAQLEQYASWGNTKAAIVVDPAQASGANALADALAGIVQALGLDSCCVLNDCAAEPEPADPHAVCGDGRVEGMSVVMTASRMRPMATTASEPRAGTLFVLLLGLWRLCRSRSRGPRYPTGKCGSARTPAPASHPFDPPEPPQATDRHPYDHSGVGVAPEPVTNSSRRGA
jgi:hypothetical protein